MWCLNKEHRDPEAVSFLQISAVFLAITAATDSLLGHHAEMSQTSICIRKFPRAQRF